MQIIKRAAAIKAGLKRYFTGKPCKRGHIAERHVDERMCIECLRLRGQRDRIRYADYYAQYRAENRAKHLAYNRTYYGSKAESLRDYAKRYRRENAELVGKRDAERRLREAEVRRERERNRWRNEPEKMRERLRLRYLKHGAKIRADVTKYRKANPDKVREQRRPGVNAARARRQKAEGKFKRSDVEALFVAQNSLCAVCSVDISAKFHVDHIVPLKRGGSNWPSNLQLLCQPCNLSKGKKTMAEWLAWRAEYQNVTLGIGVGAFATGSGAGMRTK